MNDYKCFVNKGCKFYPCHDIEEINCMFCLCPLYFTDCGGNYSMIESKSKMIKDCSSCVYPHDRNNYNEIMKKLTEEIYKNAESVDRS